MFKTKGMSVAASLVIVLALVVPVLAGPPLICHPFNTARGPLLAWGDGPGWNTPDRSYDLKKLPQDVARILTPDVPVLTRMENLRRATIYAMQDPAIAQQLVKALTDRAASGSQPIASFDAGYVIEAYHQGESLRAEKSSPAWAAVDQLIKTDGYALVKKAMAAAGAPNPQMEFAASLMTQGQEAADHRSRAAAGARTDAALAANLAKY